MKTLIKNGRIVTAIDDYHADILIENDRVSMIATKLDMDADVVVDAAGKLVIPGGIDPHTHMELPFGGTQSSDDFRTGTIAAAHGGTTSIIDFAVQYKGQSLIEGIDNWHKKAEGKTAIDYGFHLITTELEDKQIEELYTAMDEGITSFKMFMAYPSVFLVDDATIFRAMSGAGSRGGLICMHAETGIVINEIIKRAIEKGHTAPKYHALTRPTVAEAEGVHRAIAIAEMAESPVYIVHLSCADALNQVRQARDRGIPAFAETCPQYLFLSIDNYDEPGFDGAKYVMSPPLRERWHQDELWKGLARNDLQVVSTDHCPFCMTEGYQGLPKQKQLGVGDFSKIPNGAPGVETRMVLLYDGGVVQKRITLNRWVEVTSTTPAKIMGMFPKKGTIAVGSDADIVLWDPRTTSTISAKTHHMRVDYNPYEGRKVKGKASVVLSRGEVIVQKDEFLGKKGRGKFIKRGSPILQT